MPVAGLEPARINRRILSAVRLPFRHTGVLSYYTEIARENQDLASKKVGIAKISVSCIIER